MAGATGKKCHAPRAPARGYCMALIYLALDPLALSGMGPGCTEGGVACGVLAVLQRLGEAPKER